MTWHVNHSSNVQTFRFGGGVCPALVVMSVAMHGKTLKAGIMAMEGLPGT